MKSLHRQVHLDHISYHFPSGFKATNVSVDDYLTIKRMYVQFNPKTLFEKNIEIVQLELVDPTMVLTQKSGPAITEEAPNANPASADNSTGNKYTYSIKKVIINNGLLNYINKKTSQPVIVEMTHLKGQLLNLEIPITSHQIQYSLEAMTNIKNTPFEKNMIYAKGWIDLARKDLQGTINVRDPKGHDQMKVKLDAVNNDLSVDGVIKLKASQINDSASVIMNQLIQDGDENQDLQLEAGFSFKRKLDDFRLDDLKIPFNGVVRSTDAP
ncbi:MAG: hypothetical protein AB7S78_05385 [Candidatus Omnitrophota bacterium]